VAYRLIELILLSILVAIEAWQAIWRATANRHAHARRGSPRIGAGGQGARSSKPASRKTGLHGLRHGESELSLPPTVDEDSAPASPAVGGGTGKAVGGVVFMESRKKGVVRPSAVGEAGPGGPGFFPIVYSYIIYPLYVLFSHVCNTFRRLNGPTWTGLFKFLKLL
jgi:hypothetical protein